MLTGGRKRAVRRAAELGVTVSELIAELATLDGEPIVVESGEIAELDRRWKKIEAGQATVPHERVVRWLRTWGPARSQGVDVVDFSISSMV
jgi:hypothetical protein